MKKAGRQENQESYDSVGGGGSICRKGRPMFRANCLLRGGKKNNKDEERKNYVDVGGEKHREVEKGGRRGN